MDPTKAFELRSRKVSALQSPSSGGIAPETLASEITSLVRNSKEEIFDGNEVNLSGTDCITISET